MNFSDSNIHFIRHAESSFNQGTEQFKLKLPEFNNLTFDQLSKFRQFREQVRFSKNHIDCSITQKGRMECKIAQDHLLQQKINPDLILVSPLNRTLETCQQIFGLQPSTKVICQPLFGQILKSSCDISLPLINKKTKYSFYHFDQCQKLGDHWYLKKNSKRHKDVFRQFLGDEINMENQIDTQNYQDRVKGLLKKMDQEDAVQSQWDLYQRCGRAIRHITQKYSHKYKEIAIVTHFKFMNCVSATQYDSQFMPIDGVKTKNCEVYSTKLSDLLQKYNDDK